jgi:cytochrome d ubiquinol oxidase subunit I
MNALAAALSPVHQQYLLEARQMQALSFAVHIPLVCFGIAFPAMVLFAEWMGMRTGDPVYRTVARRWSRIVLALFAVGVITGTILSFEMGLLWPNFTATFGSVFGLGFAIEGFSFFMEAIFIGIYAYGWDRLSPRLHFLSGIPIRGRPCSATRCCGQSWSTCTSPATWSRGSSWRAPTPCAACAAAGRATSGWP